MDQAKINQRIAEAIGQLMIEKIANQVTIETQQAQISQLMEKQQSEKDGDDDGET